MQTLRVPENSPLLDRIEAALRENGEVVLTRGDAAVARVLLPVPARPVPSRAALRATMPVLSTPSEVYVRADRDAR